METTTVTAHELLREVFGHEGWRPGQEAAVERLLAGRSTLAVFPTGSGKSLCFQLPALMLDGLTLVVSPLLALMKDQVDALRARGVNAARIDSTQSGEEVRAIHAAIDAGALKLLYVAPERLANERFVTRLRRTKIALLAVDEAHCVSEWGHNFRPDYLRLARMAKDLRVERVLALTATATPAVGADIRREFGIADEDEVRTGAYRPNLELVITPSLPEERLALLRARLAAYPGPAIVYVTLQRTAEEVAERLGVEAACYHAGLEDEERVRVQEAFLAGRVRVVVATIAFGMGIDKADVRAVYHWNLPKTLESYAQEVGRAGRDGKPSRCELFACADDLVPLTNFSHGDAPADEALRALVEEVLGQGDRFELALHELSAAHDVRPLVVATALTYLELDGVLEPTAPTYSTWKLELLVPPDEIVRPLDPERQKFIRDVLAAGKQGRTWLTLEPAEVARRIGQPRGRVLALLSWLEEQSDARVEVAGLRHGFRRTGAAPADLGESMAKRFAVRETRDVERTHAVARWAEARGCRVRALVGHFGEELGRECGHCSGCAKGGGVPLPATPRPPLGAAERSLARELAARRHPALLLPRQRARFLCGISSPATTRGKLTGDGAFGALASHPFLEVLALCQRT